MAFSIHTIIPPKLDNSVGPKSHLFQPPKTPSFSSSLHQSIASLPNHHDEFLSSRKRSWHASFVADEAIPYLKPYSAHSHTRSSMAYDSPCALTTSGAASPTPFVNTEYHLADGLDTPTTALASAMDAPIEDVGSAALHLYGARGLKGFDPMEADGYFPRTPSALVRETNGRPRLAQTPGLRDGLGKAVYRVASVAGRVWEFCRTTACRGFYDGGGRGYEMKPPLQYIDGEQRIWQEAEEDDVFTTHVREKSSIPGCFSDEEFILDYMSRDHTPPLRASKRRQCETGNGKIGASWVMVGSTPPSRDSSPSRVVSRKLPSRSSARRPMTSRGRKPMLPASRPALTPYAGSPGMHSHNFASFASTRSPLTSPKHESPASVEVQRHALRMRKRELEEDANLRRFNQQLKTMIRQGKEALRTKFEVEEENDEPHDEGYAEGERCV